MADPHIKSPMDFWDNLTVILYRSGFMLAAIMTALLPYRPEIALLGILTAATLCASSLHIYLKHFRLLLQMAIWVALLCQIFGFSELALGAAFFTLGGLCFKEYFCFKIFCLNLQPLFVALLWGAWVSGITLAVQVISALCALLFGVLFIQKSRMPLHFDIGDKSKYQV
ncbi:MAG TPA: hypothetical protein DD638_10190 [Pasteurellaceae bacterium]|nr:hypothetical protein [Pasteurellaceae bacterium]